MTVLPPSGGSADEPPVEPTDETPDEPADESPEYPAEPGPDRFPEIMSPAAARRRCAAELRNLRDAVGLDVKAAGTAIERSGATISRFESVRYVPRTVEVVGLLDHYRSIKPEIVTAQVQEWILFLLAEGRKSQWFDPFKDSSTGDMFPAHVMTFVEYETDANEIRAYESDVVPGILQTFEYAKAIAQLFYPNRRRLQISQFAEFRVNRREMLRERADSHHLSLAINEVALHRVVGDERILSAQLVAIRDLIRDEQTQVDIRVVPRSVAVPAVLGGPFVIFSFPDELGEKDLVYLETRSGGNYLGDQRALTRFNSYYDTLLDVALRAGESADLIDSIIGGLST